MMPKPPALVTAAANSGPAATFIPTMGLTYCWFVRAHKITHTHTSQDGVFDAKHACEGSADGLRHSFDAKNEQFSHANTILATTPFDDPQFSLLSDSLQQSQSPH